MRLATTVALARSNLEGLTMQSVVSSLSILAVALGSVLVAQANARPVATSLLVPASPLHGTRTMADASTENAAPIVSPRAVPVRIPPLSIDPDKVFFTTPGDGATWARTEAYKVSFARDAVTYVPFFGSAAPQDYPVAMHLDSVTVGDAPIELAGDVEPQREGDSVTYARGNVTETYALTGKQVEQTFTLTSLPGSGDLVLRIGVQTELQLALQTTPQMERLPALGEPTSHATRNFPANPSSPTPGCAHSAIVLSRYSPAIGPPRENAGMNAA
jgi:hypothetical protein